MALGAHGADIYAGKTPVHKIKINLRKQNKPSVMVLTVCNSFAGKVMTDPWRSQSTAIYELQNERLKEEGL